MSSFLTTTKPAEMRVFYSGADLLLVSEVQVATSNASVGAKGRLTPDFLTLSDKGSNLNRYAVKARARRDSSVTSWSACITSTHTT